MLKLALKQPEIPLTKIFIHLISRINPKGLCSILKNNWQHYSSADTGNTRYNIYFTVEENPVVGVSEEVSGVAKSINGYKGVKTLNALKSATGAYFYDDNTKDSSDSVQTMSITNFVTQATGKLKVQVNNNNHVGIVYVDEIILEKV